MRQHRGALRVLNDDLIDDLIVLERLNDPAVGNLVEVIHGMLDAVYQEGELNRLPETVDLMSVLYAQNLLPPHAPTMWCCSHRHAPASTNSRTLKNGAKSSPPWPGRPPHEEPQH